MIKKMISFSVFLLLLLPTMSFSEGTTPGPIIKISCENAELKAVIDTIGSIWGVDIIYGDEVIGKMAPPIKLTNVSCAKALEIVLDLQGFSYEWDGNLIRVKKKAKSLKVKEEVFITQIYILKNTKAEEIAESPSLKELLTERGRITVDKKLNALSITDIESNVGRVANFVKRLDEGEKVTRIIPLNFAKACSVASSGILNNLLSESGMIKTDTRTNSLIITDAETNIKEIEEFVKKVDLPTPQVMIEATILETNYDYTRTLGFDWQIQKKLAETTYDAHIALGAGAETGGIFSLGTLTADQFATTIEALESKTETTILSNPRIATLDNQQAIIKVGKKLPILTTTVSEGVVTSSTSYIDTSVTLTVTPRITPEGDITLALNTKVTDSLGIDAATGSPILATSEAQTTVLVKSGQTVVIGGLLKETKPTSITKVPFLGDIPILGWLFKKRTTGPIEKRDLLIFVTPRVIKQWEKPPEKKSKK